MKYSRNTGKSSEIQSGCFCPQTLAAAAVASLPSKLNSLADLIPALALTHVTAIEDANTNTNTNMTRMMVVMINSGVS